MPSFTYVARETGSGREIRSNLEAVSEQAAIASLLNRNLLVVSIQEKIGKKGRTGGGSVSLADLVVFTRQLATMIDAGLAMVQSLQALAEQTTNKVMKDVIKDVCSRVEGGDSFSEALSKHPKLHHSTLRLHGGRRRTGRSPGRNHVAIGDLSGKYRPPPEESEIGDDVSDGGHFDCHRYHDFPAGQSRSGLRRSL